MAMSYEELKEAIVKKLMEMSNEDMVVIPSGNEILMKNSKGEHRLDFNAVYERHLQGESIEHAANMMLEPLFRHTDMFEGYEDWKTSKLKVFPQFKNTNDLSPLMITHNSPIPSLSLVYVIDADKGMMFVTPQILGYWEIEIEELHQQAMSNLRSLSKKSGIKLLKDGELKFYFSSSNDGYDAVRILTANYQQIKQTLKGRLYVGLPNRDMVIIFNGNEDFARRFINQNNIQFQTHRYRLTPLTFEWDGKTFSPIL